jgi:nucleoside phosphorylase
MVTFRMKHNISKKILVLLAVADELGAENIAVLSDRCTLRLMGVGKLRAYEATLRALNEQDYDVVVNVGTCGSFKHPYATLLCPSVVAQGDIYLDSMFKSHPITLPSVEKGVSIVSSDNFIGEDTPASQRQLLRAFDCMDMEAYAVVRAVGLHSSLSGKQQPEVYILKIVSDGADGTLGDWNERIAPLRPQLTLALHGLLNKILYK